MKHPMVTVQVSVNPPSTVVTVMVAVPALTPVTTPELSTVAAAALPDAQVTALLVASAGDTVAINVSVAPVALVVVALSKLTPVTAVAFTFTATVLDLDAGVIANPAGSAISTVTVSPFNTVIAEIVSVRVVPVLVNVPFVAPVTVMLSAVKVVGSTLNVRVNTVVVSVPDVPFAIKSENATAVAAVSGNAADVTSPEPAAFVAATPSTVKESVPTPVKV